MVGVIVESFGDRSTVSFHVNGVLQGWRWTDLPSRLHLAVSFRDIGTEGYLLQRTPRPVNHPVSVTIPKPSTQGIGHVDILAGSTLYNPNNSAEALPVSHFVKRHFEPNQRAQQRRRLSVVAGAVALKEQAEALEAILNEDTRVHDAEREELQPSALSGWTDDRGEEKMAGPPVSVDTNNFYSAQEYGVQDYNAWYTSGTEVNEWTAWAGWNWDASAGYGTVNEDTLQVYGAGEAYNEGSTHHLTYAEGFMWEQKPNATNVPITKEQKEAQAREEELRQEFAETDKFLQANDFGTSEAQLRGHQGFYGGIRKEGSMFEAVRFNPRGLVDGTLAHPWYTGGYEGVLKRSDGEDIVAFTRQVGGIKLSLPPEKLVARLDVAPQHVSGYALAFLNYPLYTMLNTVKNDGTPGGLKANQAATYHSDHTGLSSGEGNGTTSKLFDATHNYDHTHVVHVRVLSAPGSQIGFALVTSIQGALSTTVKRQRGAWLSNADQVLVYFSSCFAIPTKYSPVWFPLVLLLGLGLVWRRRKVSPLRGVQCRGPGCFYQGPSSQVRTLSRASRRCPDLFG